MMNRQDEALREHVLYVLRGGGAHISVEEALTDWPVNLRAVKPAGAAHTAWQLLEHMRIAQWDILEFSRNPKHVSPEWPGGYWPATEAPPNRTAWGGSIASFKKDLAAMEKLIE